MEGFATAVMSVLAARSHQVMAAKDLSVKTYKRPLVPGILKQSETNLSQVWKTLMTVPVAGLLKSQKIKDGLLLVSTRLNREE